MAGMIANICASSQSEKKLCIIDAGDGKGYLSSHLSVAYDLKVLGIDSKCSRTLAAFVRQKLLLEYLERKSKRQQSSKFEREQYMSMLDKNYRNATHFITPHTDFLQLFGDNFEMAVDNIPGLCLSGLHTCGDLASTCLRIYCESNQIAALCNVGCCYHKNTERFNDSHQFNYKPEIESHAMGYGFPLSQYMTNNPIGFGSTARQVSVESVHRLGNITDDDKRFKTLYHRALLEVLIQRKCPQYYGQTATGRIRHTNFIEYVRKVNARNVRLCFGEEHISEMELIELYDEYQTNESFMVLYSMMRSSLGSIIETIITLDRFLYLKENERPNDVSYLVKCFDPIISPRCYGLVAMKNIRTFW